MGHMCTRIVLAQRSRRKVILHTEYIGTFLIIHSLHNLYDAIDLHYSEIHGSVFCTSDLSILDPEDNSFIRDVFDEHLEEIFEISEGKSMWKGEISAAMQKLRYFMKHSYLFFPYQGHFIEGGIKDAAITGQTGAEEKRQNELAII